MSIQDSIRDAGIVGAGGAGFPAHVKAAARVNCVIANGAECEPLVHKDLEVMARHTREIVRGLELMMEATGASEGIIGVKEKNKGAVKAFEDSLRNPRIRLHLLGDFYPSGDEYILVYEATGRLIPPQGIPLAVGVVVNNVETLLQIAAAAEGEAVTHKFVTIAGAVHRPVTLRAPVGTTFRDAIDAAGGATARSVAVFAGGIMMGKLEFDLDCPITKTTAGLIVLPADHPLVIRKSQPEQSMHRIGKSACDQCSYCTELCPRYILGYDVQPHKVMRSLGFTSTGEDFWNQYAVLCCACGLCTLYACPESLFPKEACDRSKADMKTRGVSWSGPSPASPHPMYEGRRTPTPQLMKRLGITRYDVPSRFADEDLRVGRVQIPLSQHVGVPSRPLVKPGNRVTQGQCIGEVEEGKLGARVHASITGVVRSVDSSVTIERV